MVAEKAVFKVKSRKNKKANIDLMDLILVWSGKYWTNNWFLKHYFKINFKRCLLALGNGLVYLRKFEFLQ
jgi:hypothetical protein